MENEKLLNLAVRYDFERIDHNKLQLLIDNDSNCQSKVIIRLLNDNETIRVSVCEPDGELIDAVDMFETQDTYKAYAFLDLLI